MVRTRYKAISVLFMLTNACVLQFCDVLLNQSSLDPHSPNFYTSHLQSDVLYLHLFLKSMTLLHQVVRFLQYGPSRLAAADEQSRQQFRESSAFIRLRDLITQYQQSFPNTAQQPFQLQRNGQLDGNLLQAHLVPHV